MSFDYLVVRDEIQESVNHREQQHPQKNKSAPTSFSPYLNEMPAQSLAAYIQDGRIYIQIVNSIN